MSDQQLADGVRFRSDVTAKLVQHVGGDLAVTRAARVSVLGAEADETPEAMGGLIRYLMKNRHASPFEHGSLTFLVECPIFVAREWMRHRVWSFNELSGRYRHFEPVFWAPDLLRPIKEPDGFKPARPLLKEGDEHDHEFVQNSLARSYREAWLTYQSLLRNGVAREVARTVLPVGTYTAFYATANPRNLMGFLSLRTSDPASKVPGYPMAEIEQGARACEAEFARLWPLTHSAWVECGRTAV